jgi:23S rRNA (cytosine1962-C5)-methyltransferase
VWKLEEGLPGLIADTRKLLDADSRFLFLTVYAVRMSALAIGELVRQSLGDLPGKVEAGELTVREETRGLMLPTAIFARWSR